MLYKSIIKSYLIINLIWDGVEKQFFLVCTQKNGHESMVKYWNRKNTKVLMNIQIIEY